MLLSLTLAFLFLFFFFTDPATTEIYTLSLHDALPISQTVAPGPGYVWTRGYWRWTGADYVWVPGSWVVRSEEHTSELQSHSDLVCRLLLEKKKNNDNDSLVDHADEQLVHSQPSPEVAG